MNTEPHAKLDGVEVLLVEDDAILSGGMTRNLLRLGASVSTCPTIADARDELRRKAWHVIVLDQLLPDGDGLDLVEFMGELPVKPAVVAVSGNLQSSSRSLALQTSGAMLLPKPFTTRELCLAISGALGRRESELEAPSARSSSQVPDSARTVTRLCHGPLALDLVGQMLEVDGAPVDLQPAQFRILATLLSNVGRPVSAIELAQSALRGTHQDGNVNIRFQIHGLRRRLGPRGVLVETCAGGYGIGVSVRAAHPHSSGGDGAVR